MMKTTAILALLSVFVPAARAEQALLWLPADVAGAEEVVAALEAGGDRRLTAAFDELPKGLEERIKKLEQAGRLELALRPAGDPPVPLLYYPAAPEVSWTGKGSTAALTSDRYFLAARLGMTKEAAYKAFRKNPEGLAAAPGGLVPDYFPVARALGIKWLATGPSASTAAAVTEFDGVYAVPFVRYSSAAADAPFIVFDETSAPDPAALRALLAAELSAAAPNARVTVSQALKLFSSTSATAEEVSSLTSPWSGDYSPWASAPQQAGALKAFARTRADLMLYLNACQGDYKAARPAFDEYFAAEAGPKLAALASADPEAAREAEIELQNTLGNVYRLMQKQPPPWAFSSLADAADEGAEDKLQIKTGATGFEVVNTARKPEPPAKSQLSAGADPHKVWKLASFAVETGADMVKFSFSPQALDNPQRLRSGFGHIRLDLYMDINHRPRAGLARPLEGRPLRMFPDSAWEYALEVTPQGASLYKITPRGPARTGSFQPKAENGAVTVSVPRALLRGNPLRWGYAALLLAPAGETELSIADYIAASVSGGYIHAVRPGKR
ncbi:MAG: glucodextranase DOMON-like domain-containing protein [Elusimicrobiales bacterium]